MQPIISANYRPDFSRPQYGYFYETRVDTLGNTRKFSIFEGGIKGGPREGESGTIGFSLLNNLQAKVLKKTDTSQTYENIDLIKNIGLSGNYNFLADSMKLSPIDMNTFTTRWPSGSASTAATAMSCARNCSANTASP
jgi:hypothetical protein